MLYIMVNIIPCISDISFAENSSHSDLRDLLSELDLLKKLKPHPNVIQLKGCLTKDAIRCKGKRDLSKWRICAYKLLVKNRKILSTSDIVTLKGWLQEWSQDEMRTCINRFAQGFFFPTRIAALWDCKAAWWVMSALGCPRFYVRGNDASIKHKRHNKTSRLYMHMGQPSLHILNTLSHNPGCKYKLSFTCKNKKILQTRRGHL